MSRIPGAVVLAAALAATAGSPRQEGFRTDTFGDVPEAQHRGTVKVEGEWIRIDVSALPEDARIARAVLRFPFRSGSGGHEGIRLVPAGVSDRHVPTRPPDHQSLDLTGAVRAWRADPAANRGLRIEAGARADFRKAVLEVSYPARVSEPLPVVTQLAARHRDGQTFLTWKEPEDVVGRDGPAFEEFERAVLEARAKRRVLYRIYRSRAPIGPAGLAGAEIVGEVPEAISCWNLLAVANTEHPRPGETKRSPLRDGNLVLAHPMTRYRLRDNGPPLPRGTGLAVLTAREPGTRYYAVTVVVDGREAVSELTAQQSLEEPVPERPAEFPAIVYQRTRRPRAEARRAPSVDVHVCWLEPPRVHKPRAIEIYRVRWPDLPEGPGDSRLPLYMNLGTYGGTATQMSNPIWHAARRYVPDAVTIGLAEEGTLWAGDHESLGTLRGLEEGVVWNHEQRRVLATTAWAIANPDFSVDPERVYIWGQFAGWALRHGDLFAAVLSNGHNTFKTSREGRKHAWRWGLPGHGTNWLGVDHLDYLDLARWVRENPGTELPFWVCAPAYGAFPDHTLGDFGFKPWQEFIGAMKETRRAFSAVWMSNGPGLTEGVCRDMVPRIRLRQSLPAFSNGSLDTSPMTGNPRGSYRPGKYDRDFQEHADKEGGINLFQRWDPEGIEDGPGAWAVTAWLAGPDRDGRFGAPADSAEMDLTPRRCRRFKAAPGQEVLWTATSLEDGKVVQSGMAVADGHGLVTLNKVILTKEKRRISIRVKER